MVFNYYSGVVATALVTGATSGDTDLSVDSGATYPDPAAPGYGPYKIIVGYETSREEVCLVTAKPSANVLRVTRAQDSTPATAKNAGDVIVVGISAADYREINLRLPLAGGTMTGDIVLAGAPSSGLHPATKAYTDAADALALPKAGGTMTGALVLAGAPTADLHPATKLYTDTAVAGKADLASPTFTGNVVVPTADADGEAVNKGQMDAADALKVAKAGDTMTGALAITMSGQTSRLATLSEGGPVLAAQNSDGSALVPVAVATPTGDTHAVTKAMFDGGSATNAALTMESGWVASAYRAAKCGGLATVRLLACYKNTGSVTTGDTVATVPAGYRPQAEVWTSAVFYDGTNSQGLMLSIDTAGLLKVRGSGPMPGAASARAFYLTFTYPLFAVS